MPPWVVCTICFVAGITKLSWISTGDASADSMDVDVDFSASGVTVESTLGLSNRTMWKAMQNLVGSTDIGSRTLMIAPFKFTDQASAVICGR